MLEGKESDLLAACVGEQMESDLLATGVGRGRSRICLKQVWEGKESDLLAACVGREGV